MLRSLRRNAPELIRGHWPFALVLLFALFPFGAGPYGATEGSGLRQFVLIILFLTAAFTIIRFPDRYYSLSKAVPLTMILLLVYIFLSVIWSPQWYVSFKRAVQVLGVFLIAAALSTGGQGRPRVANVAAWVMLFGMIVSIVWTVFFFDHAFTENGYRGITANKNTFGQYAALCIFIGFAMSRLEIGSRRLIWITLLGLGVVGLLLSRSATSILAVAMVVSIYLAIYVARRLHKSWFPVVLLLFLVLVLGMYIYVLAKGYSVFYAAFSKILAGSGKDITLSGRTYLWELIWKEAMNHPWFGIGYGGFWLGLDGASGQVAYQVKWGYPGQAHNGYLDILNELGIVGCLLVLGLVVEHSRNVLRLIGIDRWLGMFHATLLVMVVVLNLAEATFLRTTHIWWIIFVASVVECGALTRTRTGSHGTTESVLRRTAVPA